MRICFTLNQASVGPSEEWKGKSKCNHRQHFYQSSITAQDFFSVGFIFFSFIPLLSTRISKPLLFSFESCYFIPQMTPSAAFTDAELICTTICLKPLLTWCCRFNQRRQITASVGWYECKYSHGLISSSGLNGFISRRMSSGFAYTCLALNVSLNIKYLHFLDLWQKFQLFVLCSVSQSSCNA